MKDDSSSALAVAEKRPPPRPGGCVGVLFQFFNWNHRLAKKKLFSKDFLQPARANRITKKIGGSEKLPMAKLLLIADENRGNFPSSKKSEACSSCSLVNTETNDEMQTPGLVARLMGLESMPAVRRDKPKKVSSHFKKLVNNSDKLRKNSEFLSGQCDLKSTRGPAKVNLKAPKLQKMAPFDRQLAKRLGAEALELRNVLSSSRNHHKKLVSSVKSTRVLSGRNAVRLMEAASKILEPGLKETNRARSSLTYSVAQKQSLKDKMKMEGMVPKQLTPSSSGNNNMKGQFGVNGDSLDALNLRQDTREQVTGFSHSFSGFYKDSSFKLGKNKSRTSLCAMEKDRNVDNQRPALVNQDCAVSQSAQAQANVLSRTKNSMDRKLHHPPHPPLEQDMSASNWQNRSLKGLNNDNLEQNRALKIKDDVLPRPKLCNQQSTKYSSANVLSGDKGYSAFQRNMGNNTIVTRMPSKSPGYGKISLERIAFKMKDESASTSSTCPQKRRLQHGPKADKRSPFVNKKNAKSEDVANSIKDTGIVSFTFSSQMRHSSRLSSPVELADAQKYHAGNELHASPGSKVISNGRKEGPLRQRNSCLRGDNLGFLIEQKIREISSFDAEGLGEVGSFPGQATASGLEELVCSITAGSPFSQGNVDELVNFGLVGLNCMDDSDCSSIKGRSFDTNTKFQADVKVQSCSRHLFPNTYNYNSPTSILEASFSAESCLSGSVDGSIERLHDSTSSVFPDEDLLDSRSMGIVGSRSLIDLVLLTCKMHGIESSEIVLRSKSRYVGEILFDIELLFGNLVLYTADDIGSSLIDLLLGNMELLTDSLWQNAECSSGFKESMKGNKPRRWLLDCIMVSFDSKYGHYCNSGYGAWSKLPSSISIEQLTRELYEEIVQWTSLAGCMLDKKIDWEFSRKLSEWTNFELETFEVGGVIEEGIFQILLDETMVDLGER